MFFHKDIYGKDIELCFLERLRDNIKFNSVGRPDFIAYKFEDRKNPFVKLACNTMGAHLITWTVRSEEDMIASELEGAPVIFEGFIPTPASLIN